MNAEVEQVQYAIQNVARAAHGFGGLLGQHEAATRYAVVDPILWSLGWSTWLPWECQPDFALDRRRRVDYALFAPSGEPAVFIQVRPLPARRQQDRDRMRETLARIRKGVAVLTYGWEWEIYDLGHRARDFAHKRVDCLVLDHDAPHHRLQVADALCQWLGKDRWW